MPPPINSEQREEISELIAARVLEKLGGQIQLLHTRISENSKRLDEEFDRQLDRHDTRIRALERWQYKGIGIMSAIIAVVSPALFALFEWLFNKGH